jgi:hypothetical protein
MPRAAESTLRLRRWLGSLTGILLAVAAIVHRPGPGPRLVGPATGEVAPFARGPFGAGAFAADPAGLPMGVVARGSYIGGDVFQGTFISGWFRYSSSVELMIAGYPNGPGNALWLEVRLRNGGMGKLSYLGANPRETWIPWSILLPADAQAFRIVAVDGSSAFRGWLAVSEPYRPGWRLTLTSVASRSLLAFVVQGLLFAALALALAEFANQGLRLPPWLVPISAIAGAALLGYVAFWLYLASPWLGRGYSWVILAGAAAVLIRNGSARADGGGNAEWGEPLLLAGLIGAGAVALTCLFNGGSFSYLAANRFLSGLPVDNQIPEIFAERLWSGQTVRNFLGDWLSSDRPPLQTGWLLLTRPILMRLGFDNDTAAGGGGVCFQLLWVPAMWALLRRMGARPRQAAAVIAAMSFTGFFLIFTVFTWPKLGAASLLLAAFVVWSSPSAESADSELWRFALAGACAALGWLAHGGIAFSLIGLLPLALFVGIRRREGRGALAAAAIAFAVLALPWLAYQKFYDPPGNRLLKWHLAGVTQPDGRGFGAALVDGYRAIGWRGALANRRLNLSLQWAGEWRRLASFRWSNPVGVIRAEQFYYSLFTFGWWLPALIFLPRAVWRERKTSAGIIGLTTAWWLAGWLTWIALLFLPSQALIHQGTLLTPVLGFALIAWCALQLNRMAFLVCASFEVLLFLVVWVPAAPAVASAVSPLAAAVSIIAGLILAEIVITGSGKQTAQIPEAPSERSAP